MDAPRDTKLTFSQRHPFLFGFTLILVAMVLFFGFMALVRFTLFDHKKSGSVFTSQAFGLVRIEGLILDSRPVTAFLRELKDNKRVKGVILRIDSPGGGVSASQEIHRAVQDLAKTKPVVASMGSVAASGGYYVASSATAILANPGTITGSIGVKMELSNLMGLLDTLGINNESIVSGKLKDAGSPYRELTREERAYFQGLVADLFDQFVTDVAAGRKLTPEKIKQIADGRVLTGRQAQVEGLVDGLGGLEDAEKLLKKLCSIPDAEDVPWVEGPVEERKLLDILLSSLTRINLSAAYQFRGPHWLAVY